jgi:hypothetical protein
MNGLPAVKVDRSTRWGNPYSAGIHCDHQHAVDCHRMLVLHGGVAKTAPKPGCDPVAYFWFVRENIGQLRGKNLCCWCPLDMPCHSQTLLEIANRPICEAPDA